MVKADFEKIVRQIAIMWGYSKCNQVDTFAIVGSLDVADKADLGMTRADYESGVYWSRSYVNRGKDVITRTFPMIGLELLSEDMLCCNAKYQVMFFDQKNCDDCGDCGKNISKVKADIIENVKKFLTRLHEYSLYDTGWSYNNEGTMISNIDSHIEVSVKPISPMLYDSHKGIYFAAIDIDIIEHDCVPISGEFTNSEFPEEVGIVSMCKDCNNGGC